MISVAGTLSKSFQLHNCGTLQLLCHNSVNSA